MQEDIYQRNSFYAQVGGIKAETLNFYELIFLDKMDYKLYVDPLEFI